MKVSPGGSYGVLTLEIVLARLGARENWNDNS